MSIQPIQYNPQTVFHLCEPSPKDAIKEVATRCLKELGLSLSLAAAVALFVPASTGVAVLLSALTVQFIVSIFFHSLGGFAFYKVAQGETSYEKMVSISEWWTGENFAYAAGFNARLLIHETGHSLAALALYKNPRPNITVVPFQWALTEYHKVPIGWLGKKIGPVATTFLVKIGGPAFTLLVSATLLAVGMAIREKHPLAAKYMISWSIFDSLYHASYAYSALNADPSNLTHDFVHLAILGLHPVAATITILAIPILIASSMYYWHDKSTMRTI
jgi:hypothetical protein